MCMMDLTTVEAQPIVQMLEGMGSALRFTLDHSLVHLPLLGQTTGTLCAVRMPTLMHAPLQEVTVFLQPEDMDARFTRLFVVYPLRFSVRWYSARTKTVVVSSFHRSWWMK